MHRRVPWMELTNTSNFTSSYISLIPPANRSICRRLQKQGTTLKWRWLRHPKNLDHAADIRTCVYPGMTAPHPYYYPAGINNSSTSRKGFGNPVSVKLLTTCKCQLWSKMWVFPRWHFVFFLTNPCQMDKKTHKYVTIHSWACCYDV